MFSRGKAKVVGSHIKPLELLLQVEAYQRSKRNESVDWEAYKAQFPNYLSIIEKAQKLADSNLAKIHPKRTPANPEVEGESTDIIAPDTVLGKLLVNHYRLDRVLGSGSFGTVYLAHDLVLRH